jgi:transposase
MKLPRFLSKLIPGYEVIDLKEWRQKGQIEIYFKKREDEPRQCLCSKCGIELGVSHGRYPLKLKTMPIFNFTTYVCIWREKRFCPGCKKVRSEALDFVSDESPHLTKEYAWWVGRMCEFSPVTRVADFTGNEAMSIYRLDYERMRRMFQHYKIPPFKRICVDEVYARKKSYYRKESRDKRFFTVVCDLDSRRVLWVSESRSKEALDEFYKVIGPERCAEIQVVAADQHDPYKASTAEHCPNATFVWDRFHIMQTFENAVNDDRMWLHRYICKGELKKLTISKYSNIFLKKADRRTGEERRHLEDVLRENTSFCYLELIKEAMFQIFDSKTAEDARYKFEQLGLWIHQEKFYSLTLWWKNFDRGWETFKNYFKFRVTSSLSEGVNNVIKTLKKKAYGYKNMAYFKLKILQVCGFLNSRYISMNF